MTPVRRTALAKVAAAMETEPGASPNWASIAEWLDGMSPYSQRVPVRGGIGNGGASEPRPNCSTRLAAWKAPHTYMQRSGSAPVAARCSRMRVHMYRSRSSSTRSRSVSSGRSRRNRLPIMIMTWR